MRPQHRVLLRSNDSDAIRVLDRSQVAPVDDRLANHGGSGSAHELHRPRAEDGRQERSASCRPTHRLDDDVDELASFCKGPALACGTGANPGQPVDPDLNALDIAKRLEGVVHVDDQIAHHFDAGSGAS
jgi:hypothetical protein